MSDVSDGNDGDGRCGSAGRPNVAYRCEVRRRSSRRGHTLSGARHRSKVCDIGFHQSAREDAAERVALRPVISAAERLLAITTESRVIDLHRALRSLHLFLRSERLYDQYHPRRMESLDVAYDAIHRVARDLNGLELFMERGGIVAPKLSEAHLPDARGDMQALAADLQR